MRQIWLFALLTLPIVASTAEKPCSSPVWTVDMAAKYGFRPFGLVKHPRNAPPLAWRTQQGVVFTAPDTLAIYQVRENDGQQPLEQQDASGGGGRYVLEIVFLNRTQGKEIHRLRFTTDGSGESAVSPTHDGRFLVLTGKMLRLYAPTFQEIATRPGPIGQSGERQYWHVVSISPSGKRIYAYVKINMPFLLDADTLDTIPNPKPSDVALWTIGSRFFPELKGLGPSVFTPEGQWRTLKYDSKVKGRALTVFLDAGKEAAILAFQCKQIQVFSSDAQVIWALPVSGAMDSFSTNGSLLAVAIYRIFANPFDLDLAPKPLRITIYDLGAKSERCSIRISEAVSSWPGPPYYDLSSAGSLAVSQGNKLSLYEP